MSEARKTLYFAPTSVPPPLPLEIAAMNVAVQCTGPVFIGPPVLANGNWRAPIIFGDATKPDGVHLWMQGLGHALESVESIEAKHLDFAVTVNRLSFAHPVHIYVGHEKRAKEAFCFAANQQHPANERILALSAVLLDLADGDFSMLSETTVH